MIESFDDENFVQKTNIKSGVVKLYNSEAGIILLTADEDQSEIFINSSILPKYQLKGLKIGQRICYVLDRITKIWPKKET